jgi:hypothetical protein
VPSQFMCRPSQQNRTSFCIFFCFLGGFGMLPP